MVRTWATDGTLHRRSLLIPGLTGECEVHLAPFASSRLSFI
jgi:hypothetical protein